MRLFIKQLHLLTCLTVGFVLLYDCSKHSEVLEEEYFSFDQPSECIAIFGDIQYYTNSQYISLYKHSLDWIVHNKESLRIKAILHTGDITQTNDSDHEWPNFYRAMRDTYIKIPYISAIGDHDYSWDGALIPDRYNTRFSDYLKNDIVAERIESAFEEGRMENIVVHNSIYGERYDFLVLEFGPRREVVEWANSWVSSHPDIKYILVNHEYLEQGGGRRISGLKCQSRLRNTSFKTPDQLWNQLIKCNDNILCVLCGHVGGLYALTYDKNDYGRYVPQIQHNIQGESYRYDNWLMLWQFPENSDSTVVRIINTKTNHYYMDQDTLFTFRYRY